MNETTDQTGRWQGTRAFVVEKKEAESKTVTSFILRPEDGGPLAAYKPGQFLGFRLDIPGQPKPVVRTYTISDSPSSASRGGGSRGGGASYRLSIKREPAPKDKPDVAPGLSSNYFHDHVEVGATLEVIAPSGDFFLHGDRDGPVVLLSGGVGLTPMIAMLNHIVDQGSGRPVWFIHGVQNGDEHAFGPHVRGLADAHGNVSAHIVYTEPGPGDVQGRDYDAEGFITIPMLESLGLGQGKGKGADFYLCGPPPFMKALFNALLGWGVDESRIYYEFFGPASVLKDGGEEADKPARKPPLDSPVPANGMTVTFKRSGVTVPWDSGLDNILELAEANGVIVDFSCRSGVCHTCMCQLIEGEVEYVNDGAMLPDDENEVLICSSVPKTDITVDV